MLKLALGVMLSLAQLSGSGGLPQILTPQFKTAVPSAQERKAR